MHDSRMHLHVGKFALDPCRLCWCWRVQILRVGDQDVTGLGVTEIRNLIIGEQVGSFFPLLMPATPKLAPSFAAFRSHREALHGTFLFAHTVFLPRQCQRPAVRGCMRVTRRRS